MDKLTNLKQWFEGQPAVARWLLFPLAVVVANAVLVGLICLILGKTDARSLSDAFFYDSALIMLTALALYFMSRRGSRPSLRELTSGQPIDMTKHKRPDPMPFYATTIFLAGLLLFGLSILVTYAGGLA